MDVGVPKPCLSLGLTKLLPEWPVTADTWSQLCETPYRTPTVCSSLNAPVPSVPFIRRGWDQLVLLSRALWPWGFSCLKAVSGMPQLGLKSSVRLIERQSQRSLCTGYSTGILAGRNLRKWKWPLMQWEDGNHQQSGRTQSGAHPSLARKGNQVNGNGQVLQEVTGRAAVSVEKDLELWSYRSNW